MLEFIQLCFAPVNLLFTLMLLCILGYWSMFFVGVVGLDFLDDLDLDLDGEIDVDLDLDVDVAADVDFDVDTNLDTDLDTSIDAGDIEADVDGGADAGDSSGGRTGWFISLLKFLDVGDVPLMVLLTAVIGSIWGVSILSSYYFNPALSWLTAALWFVPNFIASLFISKAMTYPASLVFKKTNSGIEKRTKIIGRRCTVTTSKVTETFGQAEIRVDDAAPITLNVRRRSGHSTEKPLKKGDEALILELVEDKGTYIVVPFDLEVN